MDWNPHNLYKCLDSESVALFTAALSLGILIWYNIIGFLWYKSAKRASNEAKTVWYMLLIIFVLCSWGGYGAIIISLSFPKTSAIIKILFMALQNAACPVFWYYARRFKFQKYGQHQKIGEGILKKPIQEMTDKEVANLARNLVKEGIERKNK